MGCSGPVEGLTVSVTPRPSPTTQHIHQLSLRRPPSCSAKEEAEVTTRTEASVPFDIKMFIEQERETIQETKYEHKISTCEGVKYYKWIGERENKTKIMGAKIYEFILQTYMNRICMMRQTDLIIFYC